MPPAKVKQEGIVDTWGRSNNRKLLDKECPKCGQLFRPLRSSSRYCSRACMWACNGKHQVKRVQVWWVNKKGYIEGRVVLKDGTEVHVKQHRWIMEQHLGRKLLKSEDVHHIDGDKKNNDVSNLQVVSHAEHSVMHHAGTRRSAEAKKNISEGCRRREQRKRDLIRKATGDES